MTQQARTFRVFVSSTFSDLKAERNALQARVFPRLRELAEQHGARFQVIDLRWGVSEEASLDQQAMDICLGEVKRCQKISPRPNFIVLLGDRYGWRPLPSRIPADEFEAIQPQTEAERARLHQWYRRDDNALYKRDDQTKQGVYLLQPRQVQIPEGASEEEKEAARELEGKQWQEAEKALHAILARDTKGLDALERLKYTASATEQEIAAGALRVEDAPEHVVCFFRSITGLPPQYDPAARDFLDLDIANQSVEREAHRQQEALKKRLAAYLPNENVHTYQARWTGDGITADHVDQLCADVYAALERIILAEFDHPHEIEAQTKETTHLLPYEPLDKTDVEGPAHRKFAEERLAFFVGRSGILQEISDYLADSGRRILAIAGVGGTGKSALMAKAVEQAQKTHPKAQIVYRFIGATPSSSDGRSLLHYLCRELSHRYGADEKDIPFDYRDLVPELARRMGLASADKPLILFLDSLDQLSAAHGARSLIWLPAQLPEHVSLIVSTRDKEDTYQSLKAKPIIAKELDGLKPDEGEDLLAQWLKSPTVQRQLQPTQREEVLRKFAQSGCNPLYLKLAFEEARLWTSYQEPQEDLTEGVAGIIEDNMIKRLKHEGNHGEMLVSHALGYLAASRYGLTEDELVDLLSRDLEVYDWFFRQTYHLPSDLVQRAVECRPGSTDEGAVAWLNELKRQKRDGDLPREVAEFLETALRGVDGARLPIVLWSRLSFDLAPYLTERLVDGSSLLNFYHRELGDVSKAVFLTNGDAQNYHAKLADYFRSKADPKQDGSWMGGNIHGLSELPYHLTSSGQREQVFELLTDYKFMEHKAEEVGITKRQGESGLEEITSQGFQDLQQDYDFALSTFYGGGSVDSGGRAPLIRSAEESGGKLQVYCPVCNRKSDISRDWLGQEITCPQEGCETKLKLNTFAIPMD
jgi:NACHT domain- and WD repeat-containing protein